MYEICRAETEKKKIETNSRRLIFADEVTNGSGLAECKRRRTGEKREVDNIKLEQSKQ